MVETHDTSRYAPEAPFILSVKAFQRRALQSESYRIIGLLCLLGALLLFVVSRSLVMQESKLVLGQALVIILAATYEIGMLVLVKRALQQERDISPAIWTLNVVVETQLPTIAILLLIESQFLGPYQALVAPAVLLYFLFIILSTLRLSPALSLLTGLASSLGYLAVIFVTRINYPNASTEPAAFPLAVYFIYAALILGGGLLAAVVASQIRNYVLAALREAELQSELDQVRHDLGIARTIQQDLLPTWSPKLNNFELAGWNQPADETGGDYFDWQALPDGRLAISLADATGRHRPSVSECILSSLCAGHF